MSEEDHSDWTECWECHGEGVYYDCFEEYACIDPEGGCDLCCRRCTVCRGKGGWPLSSDPFAPEEAPPSPDALEGTRDASRSLPADADAQEGKR